MRDEKNQERRDNGLGFSFSFRENLTPAWRALLVGAVFGGTVGVSDHLPNLLPGYLGGQNCVAEPGDVVALREQLAEAELDLFRQGTKILAYEKWAKETVASLSGVQLERAQDSAPDDLKRAFILGDHQ